VSSSEPLQEKLDRRHLIITDSGMGGLSICAEIERNLRHSPTGPEMRITYFNAWPEEHRGYNDLPDMQSRADVFDRALTCMRKFEPDRLLIACNTLSILYGWTSFARTAAIPVHGIIDPGVELFYEAMHADPRGFLVILGTRTTIESQVHRNRLVQKGIDPERIAGVACHGLAAAIERDPDGPSVVALLERCALKARRVCPTDASFYAALACTHYAYVEGVFKATLERVSGRSVRILDPKQRLLESVVPASEATTGNPAGHNVRVEVISKVKLDDPQRHAVAGKIEPVSVVTAHALLNYRHIPGLF
jgi:glutamate racemase